MPVAPPGVGFDPSSFLGGSPSFESRAGSSAYSTSSGYQASPFILGGSSPTSGLLNTIIWAALIGGVVWLLTKR